MGVVSWHWTVNIRTREHFCSRAKQFNFNPPLSNLKRSFIITKLVGRNPTNCVGLGTTPMSGFVPLVLSFRMWLSINSKWAASNRKAQRMLCRSLFCLPLALTDVVCSWIKLACLLLLHFESYSFINEPCLQHLNSAIWLGCNISAVEQNLTLEWCPTPRSWLDSAQL